MENIKFERNTFGKRLGTMLRVDFRRMLHSRLFYIIVAACLVAPILILVMTSVMDGTVSVNPQTGEETVTEGFDNVWQIIGTVSGDNSEATDEAAAAAGAMSLTSMCNINMLYFAICVLVCVFVADDFKSGYSKNIFTVRAKKTDYVVSKTVVCFFGGACMVLAFFIGAMIGGVICNGMMGLSLAMDGFTVGQLVLCMLSKLALVAVFVPIYLAVSVFAKQRLWMSLIGSFAVAMLLFMMIPMLTPLNTTVVLLGLCIGGGALFSIALGAVSGLILKNTSLV